VAVAVVNTVLKFAAARNYPNPTSSLTPSLTNAGKSADTRHWAAEVFGNNLATTLAMSAQCDHNAPGRKAVT
jgi:hypothetical protein